MVGCCIYWIASSGLYIGACNLLDMMWAQVLGGMCAALMLLGLKDVIVFIYRHHYRIHPATVVVYRKMVELFQAESRYSEEGPEVTVGDYDGDIFFECEGRDVMSVRSHRRVSYAVRVAHAAKAQVGLLSNTRANYLVYQRLCRDEMVKHRVRPSHIAHSLPLAVAACFIPLDSDWLGASIMRSDELKERVSRMAGSNGSTK